MVYSNNKLYHLLMLSVFNSEFQFNIGPAAARSAGPDPPPLVLIYKDTPVEVYLVSTNRVLT